MYSCGKVTLCPGHLSSDKKFQRKSLKFEAEYEVRERYKVVSDQNFCLLQSGRSGGGHEISYTCLLSFSHLGMCDRHAQTAATDHQVLGICNTFDPIKVNFDTAFCFVTQVTNYKKCSQLGFLIGRLGVDMINCAD